MKLKNTVEALQNEVKKQKSALNMKCKDLKDYVKSADDQIGLLREELLKVKREKNKLGSRIKILDDEVKQTMLSRKTVSLKIKFKTLS